MGREVKRSVIGALVATLTVAMVASAPVAAKGLKGKFTFAGGSSTGTFNLIIAAVTEKLKAENPDLDITIIPGGSVTNALRLGTGDFPVAMITALPTKLAYEGELEVKGKKMGPYKEIRGIASIYNQHFQFVVPKDFPASTIDEVIEKKMKITLAPGGPRGHIGVMAMRDVLSTYGVGYKDIEAWGGKVIYGEFNEATTGIQDGNIDMFTPLTAAPNGGITSLATQRPIKFLGMKKTTIEKMEKMGYATGTMPAGTYPGQDYDVTVSAAAAAFYARADFDPEIVYAITKAVIGNEAFMKGIHRRTKEDFDAKTAYKGLGVPLHPGAERAYKELGFLK